MKNKIFTQHRLLCVCILLLSIMTISAQQRLKTLEYLYSISGKKTLSGMHNDQKDGNDLTGHTERIFRTTGKYPAVWGADFSFDNRIQNRAKMIQEAEKQWKKGAIVTLSWHPCPPTQSEPCGWDSGIRSYMSDAQWKELITNGTNLNRTWKNRMDDVARHLKVLQDKGVEVLWRPFHEMNKPKRKPFWWTGRKGPEGSRKLYQIMRDYFDQKGLTNLVWVWNVQDIEMDAEAYNPGDQYWDMLTLDIYGPGLNDSWYNYMLKIAGGKPIGIGECEKLPSASKIASQPYYTYFLGWANHMFKETTTSQIKDTYSSSKVTTLDEMPGWGNTAPGNLLPEVTLTSPDNGAAYIAPVKINIAANASDADGKVTKVDFFSGSQYLGTDTTPPYNYSWANVPIGTHTITAVATDNSNASTRSASITITVSSAPSCDPVIASTDDGNIAGNVMDKDLNTRWSANGDGAWIQFCSGNSRTVSGVKIAFFKGNERVSRFDIEYLNGVKWDPIVTGLKSNGTSLDLETFTFSPVTTKFIRIVGHGNSVNTWNSFTEVEFITGGNTNTPPEVEITAPVVGQSYTAPASIRITASASDSDGGVSKVEFYNGSTLLGTDVSPPYSYDWDTVLEGNYTITAVATDNSNATTTSAAVQVIVKAGVVTSNLALNQPTTTSSGAGANAVDGNTDPASRWSANNFPHWIEVDLGAIKNISSTQVIAYQDRAYQYTISAATTAGGSYEPIVDRRGNSDPATVANPNTNTFSAIPARYVRINITGATGYTGTWAALVEFRVFGSALARNAVIKETSLVHEALVVSPNPGIAAQSNRVGLSFDEVPNTITVILKTLRGEVLYASDQLRASKQSEVVLPALPSGLYIFQVKTDKKMFVKKYLVE